MSTEFNYTHWSKEQCIDRILLLERELEKKFDRATQSDMGYWSKEQLIDKVFWLQNQNAVLQFEREKIKITQISEFERAIISRLKIFMREQPGAFAFLVEASRRDNDRVRYLQDSGENGGAEALNYGLVRQGVGLYRGYYYIYPAISRAIRKFVRGRYNELHFIDGAENE